MNFKKFYEGYHKDRKLPKRIISPKNYTYREIVSVLDKFCEEKDVLDVGSGVGTVDFYLALKGKDVTGIEISEKAVKTAKKTAKMFNLEDKTKFIRKDFLKYKPKNKFSFIICSEVLEHLKDDKKAVKKLYKLTKPGGRLMITVPSENAPLKKLGLVDEFDKESGHLRRYSMEGLKTLVEGEGFKVIYSKKTEGILRNALFTFRQDLIIKVANRFGIVSDIITFIDNILLSLFGEADLVVIAKKPKD